MRRWITRILIAAIVLVAPIAANAFSIQFPQNWIHIIETTTGGGRSYLDPQDVSHITGTSSYAQTAKSLIEADWQAISVSLSGSGLDGTVTVKEYAVYHYLDQFGHVNESEAGLDIDYTTNGSWLSTTRYVQVIWTSDPVSGQTSPYLDDNQGVGPFYYNNADDAAARHDNTYWFRDYPTTPYHGTEAFHWHAALFLTEYTTAGPYEYLTIHDGLYWGWNTIGQGEGGGPGRPVPEPISLAALLAGLVAYCGRRRTC